MDKKELSPKIKMHARELLLLFSVPIAIIVIIVAFLYIPRVFANPNYDFIYCEGYSCDNRFSVDPNGKLTVSSETDRYSYSNDYSLHYYDAQRHATRPLQIEEAKQYRLDATSKSPDGYTLKHTSGGDGFLFWSSYQNNWSLSKGIISQPITLSTNGNDDKFIGWVLQ